MKHVRALVLGLAAMLVTAAGCGGSNGSDPRDEGSTVSTLSAEERTIRFRARGDDPDPATMEATAAVLADRLRRSGVTDAEVRSDGSTIVVRLSEGSTPAARRVVEAVSRPGVLAFRPVLAEGVDDAGATAIPTTTVPAVTGPDGTPLVLGPAVLEDGVASATAAAEATGWVVVPQFDVDLTPLLDMLGQCVRREPACPTGKLAVVVDGEVLSAGEINQAARRIVITGPSDDLDAKALAAVLSTDPLPVVLAREQ